MLPPEIASGQGRLPKAMLIATLRQQPDGRGSGLQAGLCLHGIPVPDIDREGLCFPRGPCRGDLPQELQQKDEAGKLPAMFSGDQSQRRPGSDAAGQQSSPCCSPGVPQQPPRSKTPQQGCVSQGMSPAGHINRFLPWRSPKHGLFLRSPVWAPAGARQDTLDQLHHPGHARGSTSLMEQLKTGVWAGTDPSKEHLPSPPPRTPGYITQDQAEMIVCRSKSISHIWRAGDDSAAKPAAVSK